MVVHYVLLAWLTQSYIWFWPYSIDQVGCNLSSSRQMKVMSSNLVHDFLVPLPRSDLKDMRATIQ